MVNCQVNTITLHANLRPLILEDLGIEEAVKWQVDQFMHRSNCTVGLSIDLKGVRLHKDYQIGIYRIVQESLNNIRQHARASHVEIELNYEVSGHINLSITDNGIGLTREKLRSDSSIGILGMKERAYTLNGNLSINQVNTGGTQVLLRLPIGDI